MSPTEHAAKAAELVSGDMLLKYQRDVRDDQLALEQFERTVSVAQVHATLAVASQIEAYHRYVRKGE